MSQLALPLKLDDHAVFESFLPDGQEAVVNHLRRIAADKTRDGCWLTGGPATGKSHLLQALCHSSGERAVYLPLQEFRCAASGLLDGMWRYAIVCIDEVDAAAGDPDWEQALFALFNRIVESAGTLVVASRMTVRGAGFSLPDLQSRFAQLPIFRLQAPDDARLKAALKLRASHRGLELPTETADFLLARERRDMASLYGLLDFLDGEALAAQRRLTVPFVRSVLEKR